MADILTEYNKQEGLNDEAELGGFSLIDSERTEASIIAEVMPRFKRFADARKQSEEFWDDVDLAVNIGSRKSAEDTGSKIAVPLGFDAVENIMSKLTYLSAPVEKLAECYTDDPNSRGIADNKQKLIIDQFRKDNWESKSATAQKYMTYYGTCYMSPMWLDDWREVVKYGVNDDKPALTLVDRRPTCIVVDNRDVYIEPGSDNLQTGVGFYIREWKSIEEFRDLCREDKELGLLPRYSNGDKVHAITKGDKDDKSIQRAILGEFESAEGKVELLHFWGKVDLNDDGLSEECWITVANREVLVKAIRNPFDHQLRPLFSSPYVEVPGKIEGIGPLKPVMTLLWQINTKYRQRIDNIEQSINCMWQVIKGKFLKKSQLRVRPGGEIEVEIDGQVKPLMMPNTTEGVIKDIEQLVAMFYRMTMPDILTGTNTPDNVGTAKIQVTQAMGRFTSTAKLFQQRIIKPMVETFDKLNMQFIANDEVIKNFYGDLFPAKLTPEIIRTQILFKFKFLDEITTKAENYSRFASYINTPQLNFSPDTIEYVAKEMGALINLDPDRITTVRAPTAPTTPTLPNLYQPTESAPPQNVASAIKAQAESPGGVESGVNLPGTQVPTNLQ